MKSYCVKEKKTTECVPGSERFEMARNGRVMLKCICGSCGITKTQFVSQKGGSSTLSMQDFYRLNPNYLNYGVIGDNWSDYRGSGIDIHKQILKVAPKKGFVMPGHHYTGPGNPLEKQLKYDDDGNILEIYQKPTGKTDAVSMQHDVDYSICGKKSPTSQVKCKNDADRKMVSALDAIPWDERQWGHAVARNAIAAKAKLGMGAAAPKTKKKVVE